jgi:hypothetical protein
MFFFFFFCEFILVKSKNQRQNLHWPFYHGCLIGGSYWSRIELSKIKLDYVKLMKIGRIPRSFENLVGMVQVYEEDSCFNFRLYIIRISSSTSLCYWTIEWFD